MIEEGQGPNTPVNKLMDEYMSAWSCQEGMMPLARTRVIAELHKLDPAATRNLLMRSLQR